MDEIPRSDGMGPRAGLDPVWLLDKALSPAWCSKKRLLLAALLWSKVAPARLHPKAGLVHFNLQPVKGPGRLHILEGDLKQVVVFRFRHRTFQTAFEVVVVPEEGASGIVGQLRHCVFALLHRLQAVLGRLPNRLADGSR